MRLPRFTERGVPLCSLRDCPSYDGKRCKETGWIPPSICQPDVEAMAEELSTLCKSVDQETHRERMDRLDDMAGRFGA